LFSEGRDGVRKEFLLHSSGESWMLEKLRQGNGTVFDRSEFCGKNKCIMFFVPKRTVARRLSEVGNICFYGLHYFTAAGYYELRLRGFFTPFFHTVGQYTETDHHHFN
jgi:hypothetical protein